MFIAAGKLCGHFTALLKGCKQDSVMGGTTAHCCQRASDKARGPQLPVGGEGTRAEVPQNLQLDF